MNHANAKCRTPTRESFRLWCGQFGIPRAGFRAFTLIELIAVLAVIAILAAALVPVLIGQMDRIAGEQESSALKSFGDAFQQSILRSNPKSIPAYTNWAATVAMECGVDVSNVTTNGRQQPRFFLVDPNWQIGTTTNAGQIYQQGTTGAVLAKNLRILVLSSIGQRLTNMVSGVPSAADFNAIWNWNDRSSAAPSASLFSGFTRGQDLKVQRVNLSPLFVRLLLSTNDSTFKSFHAIDSTGSTNVVGTIGIDRYFIQNSVLFLYGGQTNLDSQRILTRDTSFVYDQNVWRDTIGGRSGGASTIAGMDFGSIVDQYLSAPENTNAMNWTYKTGTNQQWIVVSNMVAYLDAYSAWSAQYTGQQGSWPHDSYYNAAIAAQAKLVEAVQGQYAKVGSADYTPMPYSDSRCP